MGSGGLRKRGVEAAEAEPDDVLYVLRDWAASRPDFVVRGNEAGMKLGPDVRAAGAAIWRRSEVGPARGRLQHVAPVLAVEVAGVDEDEARLRDKAAWYLAHGVQVVWVVLPERREIGEHRAVDVQLNAAFARGLKASGRVKHLALKCPPSALIPPRRPLDQAPRGCRATLA
jgi:Putative restriction endonuclease